MNSFKPEAVESVVDQLTIYIYVNLIQYMQNTKEDRLVHEQFRNLDCVALCWSDIDVDMNDNAMILCRCLDLLILRSHRNPIFFSGNFCFSVVNLSKNYISWGNIAGFGFWKDFTTIRGISWHVFWCFGMGKVNFVFHQNVKLAGIYSKLELRV